jgi:hypothetical protein
MARYKMLFLNFGKFWCFFKALIFRVGAYALILLVGPVSMDIEIIIIINLK